MTDATSEPPFESSRAAEHTETILGTLSESIVASESFLQTVLTGALAKQHVLIEDVPGTGKTLTAQLLADALGLEFSRIQFTPDLLPGDITGSTVFNEGDNSFEFNEGPVFANIVLADEINRAPPKTQAALLEVMEEKQVSTGSETRPLPDPFFVIATQNPVDQEGTFELPESQRDRFMIKTSIGYPDRSAERELLDRRLARQTAAPTIDQVIEADTFTQLQGMPEYVHVAPEMRDYILDIGRETRTDDRVEVGVSPRGIQRLLEATRARAVIEGREFVVPDDIKALAPSVFSHRIVVNSAALIEGTTRTEIIEDVLDTIEVPAMQPA